MPRFAHQQEETSSTGLQTTSSGLQRKKIWNSWVTLVYWIWFYNCFTAEWIIIYHIQPFVLLSAAARPGWNSTDPAYSCKSIRDSGDSKGDGRYWIDPENSGNPLNVYCDMTTDGGEIWSWKSEIVVIHSSDEPT